MRTCWALLTLLLPAPALAADWPQWLGPHRDGSTSEKVAPWKEAPKVLWRQPMGEGHSSPVVAGGKVFLFAKVKGAEEEEVLALDARTGKQLWKGSYARDKFQSVFGNGPRATPTVRGDQLWTLGATGVLTCWTVGKDKPVWQVETLKEFKAKNLIFGVSCSPLVEEDRVLVNVGAPGASVVAFNKEKGEVLWKTLDDPASYSSPVLFGKGQERQAVFLTQKGLVSLNPADGALLWRSPLQDPLMENSSTPVHHDKLVVAGSILSGSIGLRLEDKEGKPAVAQAWKNPALTCYFSTPVFVGADQLYMVTGSNPLTTRPSAMQSSLRCVEPATGKVLWEKPGVGRYHATLLRTGDDKLLMLQEGGDLVLLEPNPKAYRELARAKVCGETWAHPALADGRLYVRDAKELICLDLSR